MPLSHYTIVTYSGRSGKVCAALSRFRNVTVSAPSSRCLTVSVETESLQADLAWRELLTDLRGVESCSPLQPEPELATAGV